MYTHAPADYDCPFCAMVRGDDNEPWCTQADVVHRDAKTTAWVNGRWWLNNPGGVIVVPNEHVENLYGLDRELAGDIHETAGPYVAGLRESARLAQRPDRAQYAIDLARCVQEPRREPRV